MSEKAFFHNALESDLLNGRKQKRRLDAALGRTTAKASAPVRTNTQNIEEFPRWLYIPAVAVFLVLTLAIGSVVIARGLRDEQHQAEQPTADTPSTNEPVPWATQPPIERLITDQQADVRLIPEIDTDDRINQARVNRLHLPPIAEADWGWLKETSASVSELSVTTASISWTTELRVPKGDRQQNPFVEAVHVLRNENRCFFYSADGLMTDDEGAELVDFKAPPEITYGEENDAWVVRIPCICAMPQVYDQFPATLPPTGDVTVRSILLLLDPDADASEVYVLMFDEDEQNGQRNYLVGRNESLPAATVGVLEQTFTFDAEALLNIADPVHIDVPLSGETVLTTHVNNGFRNERVTLDGVTLDAEIHYTKAGVFAILTIKNAGTLSDAQQEALYAAMNGGPDGSHFSVGCEAATGSLRVWRVSRAFWGQTKLARYEIALEPSQYDAAGQLELSVRATYATGIEGDEPRDDWSWVSSEGNLPELMTKAVPIASITIPLPGVSLANMPNPLPSQAPTRCPPTEEPDPMPILDEATLCTTWMLAEVEAPDGSSGDARALGLERYLVFRSDGTVRIIDAKAPSERVVPYTQNGNTVRFDSRVLRYDSEYNELVEIDPSSQDILFYTPSPVPTPTPVP